MSSLLHAAEEQADVVARAAGIQQLAEHLDAGDDGLLVGVEADQRDFLLDLDLATLDTARRHGAAPGDREHVLDRHQERLVDLTLRLGDERVQRVHQLADLEAPLRLRDPSTPAP
jgi:hypothetical protein